MKNYKIYPLKNLLEDMYLSTIASELEMDENDVIYNDSEDITVGGTKVETLLSAKGTSKKKVFKEAESRVLEFLKSFKCERNPDVQDFLNDYEKAIRMQKESVSRTYLLIEPEKFEIAAYFSLALKPVSINDDHKISKSKIKQSNLETLHDDTTVCSTYLIGQIGRDDRYKSSDINLNEILEFVFAIINNVRSLIGGRVLLIEVNKEPRLIKKYESCGFQNIESDTELTQLMQWVKTY